MARRLAVVTLVVAVVGAVLATAAFASKPVRSPAQAPPPSTFPAGVVCPFPVFVEAVENRQTQTVFSDGRILVTGFTSARVVNLTNGNETTLNVSGSVRMTPQGSLLDVTSSGPLLIFFFPGDAGPGDVGTGRTYLFHGRTEFLVDPSTFTFLSFSHRGQATDVCALLA